MDCLIETLVDKVQRLLPYEMKSEIEHTVSQMSRRSGIHTEVLLTNLYEDLLNGIPFQYTAVGKSRSIAQW